MRLSEILTRARDIVNKGWCKHQSTDGNGNYCALGALGLAECEATILRTAAIFEGRYPQEWLMDHLSEFGEFGFGPFGIPEFNDHPTTTKQDVLNLFDKAIASAEEKGL